MANASSAVTGDQANMVTPSGVTSWATVDSAGTSHRVGAGMLTFENASVCRKASH